MVAIPKKPKKTLLTVEIEDEILTLFKKRVKEHGISMRQAVLYGIRMFLENSKKGKEK